MNQRNLIQNMIEQIKEAQIKLGYVKETVRLYYPVSSINALLGTDAQDAEALLAVLEQEPMFSDTELGKIQFAVHEGRMEISIPPEGAEYVHQKVPDPAFLMDIIALFVNHHCCTLEEVKEVFGRYSRNYVCEKMPEGTDFDYALYFEDASIDSYYYCIKEEMGHTIYHRFTKADYEALMR